MGRFVTPPGDRTVHLCIDMQNLFTPGAPWATPWLERTVPVITALVEHAPKRTVFTRFIPPLNKDAARGVWKAYYKKWECVTREKLAPHMIELIPALARHAPPAAVIDRQTYCAFGNGRLSAYLNRTSGRYAPYLGRRDRRVRAGNRACGGRSRLQSYPRRRRLVQLIRSKP
jgi:nicotinamidase-related amidase